MDFEIDGGYRMIHFLNRRELLLTKDMKKEAEVCALLAANQIEYRVKNVIRGSAASLGSNSHLNMMNERILPEIIIYVQKKDFEYACYLLHHGEI